MFPIGVVVWAQDGARVWSTRVTRCFKCSANFVCIGCVAAMIFVRLICDWINWECDKVEVGDVVDELRWEGVVVSLAVGIDRHFD